MPYALLRLDGDRQLEYHHLELEPDGGHASVTLPFEQVLGALLR